MLINLTTTVSGFKTKPAYCGGRLNRLYFSQFICFLLMQECFSSGLGNWWEMAFKPQLLVCVWTTPTPGDCNTLCRGSGCFLICITRYAYHNHIVKIPLGGHCFTLSSVITCMCNEPTLQLLWRLNPTHIDHVFHILRKQRLPRKTSLFAVAGLKIPFQGGCNAWKRPFRRRKAVARMLWKQKRSEFQYKHK